MQYLAITHGELWLHGGPEGSVQIESPFARELLQREADSRRTTSWKHGEREDGPGMLSGPALWGRGGGSGPMAPARFLHVCQGDDARTLFYVLSVGRSVGLFRYHLDEQREVRLFHRSAVPVLGLAWVPQRRHVVLALGQPDGTAHLEVFDEDGGAKGAITSGDSLDSAPVLMPGSASTLVYQSCGVARHAQSGAMVALGHSAIHWLDYQAGQMDSLMDDPDWDYITPRISASGTVYAIRRPAEKPLQEQAGSALKDTLLMPVRLGKAVFGYLNFFSMIYGKEPLRSAGGPRAPQLDQDLGQLWLHGRMIELSKVKTDPQHAGNLVPASWELIAQEGRRAAPRVIARHVAHFDLSADGLLVYSNGFDIQAQPAEGGPVRRIGRQALVEGLLTV
ncbi:hypothetical protein PGB34_00405 [Xenophilus arseniciresistens]|uniref:Uncharacterized protein n=1 Tax=Xenophilus arseniciresistens TaxID=1283306 RepID=A0AAE3N2Z9_9BURK|nr:hypothetical protein [Xenophilus arseniciresistens]MDA7414810.1 hypothetical protein [Xenophilus arseniciresistens]